MHKRDVAWLRPPSHPSGRGERPTRRCENGASPAGHETGSGNIWDTRFYYGSTALTAGDAAAPLYSYLFESDNDKTMTVAYTVGPSGNLISQRRSGSTYYHLYDQLGSTRKLLDSNQGTTDSYSYYAFGEARTSSGSTTNPFNFVGRLGYYSDASSSLQYLRGRYYAPGYGRFGSVDPIGRGELRYAYVGNRVLVASDPSGLISFWACYTACIAYHDCYAQPWPWSFFCASRCQRACTWHRPYPRPGLGRTPNVCNPCHGDYDCTGCNEAHQTWCTGNAPFNIVCHDLATACEQLCCADMPDNTVRDRYTQAQCLMSCWGHWGYWPPPRVPGVPGG